MRGDDSVRKLTIRLRCDYNLLSIKNRRMVQALLIR